MIRVNQISVLIKRNKEEEILNQCAKKLKIKRSEIKTYRIYKKSLDARKKPKLFYSYELDIEVRDEKKVSTHNKDITVTPVEQYIFKVTGQERLQNRPVIVGSGPCGLFCAYFLAEAGYHPIILERGEEVDKRTETVNQFWETGKLNTSSNVQFGEGGAGTFSDGKLNTLKKDKSFRQKRIFEILVQAGAPKDILYENKPHIGTDLLRKIVKNLRNEIIKMGGEFHFQTTLTDINIENKKIKSIIVNKTKEIPVTVLILALGHSARDTFQMLYQRNLRMEAKPFAVGLRIQHSQKDINISQYGEENIKILPPASYKLTYQSSNGRGVYTFCMCPGGYVVNASSEANSIAVNGMSNHARESENANSAVIVTVSTKDFGNHPLDGIKFQRKLEEKAYQEGYGKIPIQTLKDFKENKKSTALGNIRPMIKGNYQFANLRNLFSDEISNALLEAMEDFEHKIKGFGNNDTILAGVESRTSSPLRILRNDEFISNIDGIYPGGEGAGYAGGITSAAIDGIKVAEQIAKKYHPFDD